MYSSENICNLLATLPTPPWTKPLNWNLHLAKDDKEHIPFASYVRPDSISPLHISSFPQFGKLPTELKVHILTFCSAPTLFQVMRVSSTLRIEASKLFWADPNSYYLIEFSWLLDGGYPGNTCHDLCFLSHVQNVEVHCGRDMTSKLDPIRVGEKEFLQNFLQNFWKPLRIRFPKVRRVVINKTWTAFIGENIPPVLQILIESSPPEIDVSAFVLEDELSHDKNNPNAQPTVKYQRALYQPYPDGELGKTILYWDRNTILAPMKPFSGPVGEFERLGHTMNRIELQERAFWPLAIEALDRHHFDEGMLEPFSCPVSGCNSHFEKAGQWTLHAAETHGAHEVIPRNQLDILPDRWRTLFEMHKSDLEIKKRVLFVAFREIYDAWNEEGGAKRIEIERGWANQLENDELWAIGQDARKSELLFMFHLTMDQDLDATALEFR